MLEHRKEHAMVRLRDGIYALGGYSVPLNQFLATCEKYDIQNDIWEPMPPMHFRKCAFGCTSFSDRYTNKSVIFIPSEGMMANSDFRK